MFQDHDGKRKVFGLSSPTQMLAKLQWENDQIKSMLADRDPKVIFAAFNAAATAWHMIEWIIESWDNLAERQLFPKTAYRNDVLARCADLEACRQISVGWKHRIVSSRNDPAIQASHVMKFFVRTIDGKIASDGPPDRTEISPAIIVGTKQVPLDAFFDRVALFWSDELSRLKFNPAFTV